MLKEFKEFALKGNMIDLAVGVIIGATFGTVMKSLVEDILMPIISGIFKLSDFTNLFIILRNPTDFASTSLSAAREAGATVIAIGSFINSLIAFLLVAWALFFIIRTMNRLKRKEEAGGAVTSSELEVLKEIRDSLRK